MKVGCLGILGMAMPRLMEAAKQQQAAPKRTAKSAVFLYQFGGPSHQETFDMKPLAAAGLRSQFSIIKTKVPGFRICEHLPETGLFDNN